jgi:protein SCO1/2
MSRRLVAIAGVLFFVTFAIVITIASLRHNDGATSRSTRFVDTAAMLGTPLDPPKTVIDALLVDGRDRPTHVIDGVTPTTMIIFGYTHCPDTCPLALASLGRAYRMLSHRARERTRIVFITVDPARDTPAVVERYTRAFDPHIVGLTGDAATLARVRDAFGVRVDARTHEISHGTTVFAVDETQRVNLVYPPDTTAKDFAHDLALLGA